MAIRNAKYLDSHARILTSLILEKSHTKNDLGNNSTTLLRQITKYTNMYVLKVYDANICFVYVCLFRYLLNKSLGAIYFKFKRRFCEAEAG